MNINYDVTEIADEKNDLYLSSNTLNALNQFYQESVNSSQILNDNVNQFNENWQLSQFWYDSETSKYLANQIIQNINKDGKVACISCPTLYFQLHQMKMEDNNLANVDLKLFEFDSRFSILQDFLFYDYRTPLLACKNFKKASFDLVVADPPFLSQECLEKISQTILFLAKDKIILNTGLVVENIVTKYLCLKKCSHFTPRHQSNLGNKFACFTNFHFT